MVSRYGFAPLLGLLIASLVGFTSASTANLPSYPLAVKSPYLSAWVPGNQTRNATTAQAQFWNGIPLTWPVLARVDGTTYTLFGARGGIKGTKAAKTVSVSYTSSHTLINLVAGAVDITLDFFSPVFPGPTEYAHQALPYSYLTVNATSTSRALSVIQVLSAIDHTWTAQNGSSTLNYTDTQNTGFFQFFNPDAIHYTEKHEQASYGSVIFGASTGVGYTAACDEPSEVYRHFVANGTVSLKSQCSGRDLAAIAQTVLVSDSVPAGVTFVVGFDRVNAINYRGKPQMGLHRTQWPTPQQAVPYVVRNYQVAFQSSLVLDATVRSKAESVSTVYGAKYADILEASVRQTFGALELTVGDLSGSSPAWAFLKEISSDGNINTVDLIFQSWQIFVSLNPEYLVLLFRPVLEYLQNGTWPHPYVIHDLGFAYPNATGHDNGDCEQLPVAETSTLFILLLVYQKLTGDKSVTAQYTKLLTGYAEWLARNTLYPSRQLNSVDAIVATANQTGLAVQGTIGLNAAGVLLNNDTLSTIAKQYATTIYQDGLGLDGPTPEQSSHFTFNYHNSTTWNVLYPSFSDVFLELSTFPSSAWDLQSKWYASQLQPAGLPYVGPDTNLNYTTGVPVRWGLTDWNIVAAATSSEQLQADVVNSTWTFMTNGLNTHPFGTKYFVQGNKMGHWVQNEARSTVGAHFAMLALQQGTWYTPHDGNWKREL